MEVKQPGSHLDHMLKQTRNHHVQLSFMADSKANMLLTISSVLITLTVPHIMTSSLKYGALILIGFCLITIILSTYAVMPKLPIFTKKSGSVNIKNPGFNFLFFGDFIKREVDDLKERIYGSKLSTDPPGIVEKIQSPATVHLVNVIRDKIDART